jgi:hypothetical protein
MFGMKSKPDSRRLHLVDVENLIGCPLPTLAEATRCHEDYAECAAVGPNDLVVVACNHGAAVPVGLGWRGARLLLRSGENGADLALIDVIANEDVADRFAGVVVASGDSRFADAVARLGVLGVEVTVVSGGRALSRRLQIAAKRVVIFDREPVPARPAAARRAA